MVHKVKQEKRETFYTNDIESLEKFALECENIINEKKVCSIDGVEEVMKGVTDKVLLKKGVWKGGRIMRKFYKKLGRLIKERKVLNRRKS